MRWQFYDLKTGVFNGRAIEAPDGIRIPVPEGCGAVPGRYSRFTRQVDVAALPPADADPLLAPWYPPVIEYQAPPPPGDALRTWVWDATAARWQPTPTAVALAQQRVRELQLQIEAAELAQARPQRELLLAIADGKAAPAEAVAKLAKIEAAAVALRAEISVAAIEQAAPVQVQGLAP